MKAHAGLRRKYTPTPSWLRIGGASIRLHIQQQLTLATRELYYLTFQKIDRHILPQFLDTLLQGFIITFHRTGGLPTAPQRITRAWAPTTIRDLCKSTWTSWKANFLHSCILWPACLLINLLFLIPFLENQSQEFPRTSRACLMQAGQRLEATLASTASVISFFQVGSMSQW